MNKGPKGNSTNSGSSVPELAPTMDTFVTRIKRKLKAQEAQQDIEHKETEQRHTRILQTMTAIRKAMTESCKLELGNRFELDLDVTDFDGWPQVELLLIDQLDLENPPVGLRVAARDDNKDGLITFKDLKGQVLEKISMSQPENTEKVPMIVKRSLRSFLDKVENYVLNPTSAEDLLSQQTKTIKVDEPDVLSSRLEKEDLFTDDFAEDQNIVEVEE